MQNSNYSQGKEFNSFQQSLKKLMELNLKTLGTLTYCHPKELLNVQKPEQFLEKNLEVLIENSHKTLDYLHDVFYIMESHWLNVADTAKAKMQDGLNKTQMAANEVKDTAVNAARKTMRDIKLKSSNHSPLKASSSSAAHKKTTTKKTNASSATKDTTPTKSTTQSH